MLSALGDSLGPNTVSAAGRADNLGNSMTAQAENDTRGRIKNTNLVAAKAARNDEFYTQWADIEREINAYLEYDPDVFRDKVVLLPCDDPEWSNFTKFFALHFVDFGLKKLISTSYAPTATRRSSTISRRCSSR